MNAPGSLIIILFIISSCSQPDEFSQWRGPERNGIYNDTDLLEKWPEEGPELIWSYEGLGKGHGTVGIAHDRVFVCGMLDSTGFLFSFDQYGKLLWKKEYGPEWNKSYEGVRTTPTVVDDLLYIESGQGLVVCFEALSGRIVWTADLFERFDAEEIQWGMAESPLINGDMVYATPGGKKANIVALDRFTGETLWKSPGNAEPAAYCSPILVNYQGTQLVVTMTAESIIAVDAVTGEHYWDVEHFQRNQIHANSPYYHQGKIVCSSASDNKRPSGTVQIELSDKGRQAEVTWRNDDITNLMNGFILIDGYVYGSPYNKKEWHCFEWNTGELQYTTDSFQSGPVIYADGMFYCYGNKGNMALVNADSAGFQVISQFRVPLGTDQHWAHPVIDHGRLFIRHGDALMVYDIAGN